MRRHYQCAGQYNKLHENEVPALQFALDMDRHCRGRLQRNVKDVQGDNKNDAGGSLVRNGNKKNNTIVLIIQLSGKGLGKHGRAQLVRENHRRELPCTGLELGLLPALMLITWNYGSGIAIELENICQWSILSSLCGRQVDEIAMLTSVFGYYCN